MKFSMAEHIVLRLSDPQPSINVEMAKNTLKITTKEVVGLEPREIQPGMFEGLMLHGDRDRQTRVTGLRIPSHVFKLIWYNVEPGALFKDYSVFGRLRELWFVRDQYATLVQILTPDVWASIAESAEQVRALVVEEESADLSKFGAFKRLSQLVLKRVLLEQTKVLAAGALAGLRLTRLELKYVEFETRLLFDQSFLKELEIVNCRLHSKTNRDKNFILYLGQLRHLKVGDNQESVFDDAWGQTFQDDQLNYPQLQQWMNTNPGLQSLELVLGRHDDEHIPLFATKLLSFGLIRREPRDVRYIGKYYMPKVTTLKLAGYTVAQGEKYLERFLVRFSALNQVVTGGTLLWNVLQIAEERTELQHIAIYLEQRGRQILSSKQPYLSTRAGNEAVTRKHFGTKSSSIELRRRVRGLEKLKMELEERVAERTALLDAVEKEALDLMRRSAPLLE